MKDKHVMAKKGGKAWEKNVFLHVVSMDFRQVPKIKSGNLEVLEGMDDGMELFGRTYASHTRNDNVAAATIQHPHAPPHMTHTQTFDKNIRKCV
jgi:hypothetical protein